MIPTLMDVSRVCCGPGGLQLAHRAFCLALASARRDVETECSEVALNDGYRWWDIKGGLFVGADKSDQEFRAMLQESVDFLDCFKQFERHPTQPNWIRFVGEVDHAG